MFTWFVVKFNFRKHGCLVIHCDLLLFQSKTYMCVFFSAIVKSKQEIKISTDKIASAIRVTNSKPKLVTGHVSMHIEHVSTVRARWISHMHPHAVRYFLSNEFVFQLAHVWFAPALMFTKQ